MDPSVTDKTLSLAFATHAWDWTGPHSTGYKLALHNTLTAHWCGWLSRTKYSSGWSHYTSPGGHRGDWSLVTTLWVTWGTDDLGHMGQYVTVLCVSRLHTTGQSPVVQCYCMLVCHRVPGPARTILHTRLTLLTAADTGLRLRPHWLTAPLQLSPLTVQGWARAHQHWWKAASPGLWASVRASHCLTICHAASDWRLAEDLGMGLVRGVKTSDLGNWHCWHIPRHRQQPFIKTTLAIWRLPHPLEKEMYNVIVL